MILTIILIITLVTFALLLLAGLSIGFRLFGPDRELGSMVGAVGSSGREENVEGHGEKEV